MKSAIAFASVANAAVVFEDKMDDLSKWTQSTWKGAEMSEFELKASKNNPDQKDMGLATTNNAKFYGASRTFDKEVSNKGKHLLVQYEVTYDTDVECGGGYLKIGQKMEKPATEFGDPTKYALMFGPDKCGHTKRTHLIFNHNEDKNVLKKTDLPYKQDEEGVTTLYRMILSPDNKVTVDVNNKEIFSGSLESDWAMLEPKEIDDPEDKKPSDWVDEAMMDDPEDKKPEDWVEIKEIVDAEAKQPEDWDTEEDGEWEAPMIPNPDYKGEWKAKRISNPAYKGVWAPKKIDNPKYKADDELYLMAKKDLAFVGFDLWQVKAGSVFDNVIIATDADMDGVKKEADARATEWQKLHDAQKAEKARTSTTTPAPSADEEDDDDDGADASGDKDDEDL